ncbi:hypothetical protein BN2476_230368 [Paraburkholderia piptadeniae]|uniref:Uncharacterized protein n=1 Tax=Paraburkholderia piptadeniae TaxID=1701573 RepID=A0A1N7RY57_9BURK|nr:hypothetical protein BN2476_230368 [Paraburkholderia piptadeniae]
MLAAVAEPAWLLSAKRRYALLLSRFLVRRNPCLGPWKNFCGDDSRTRTSTPITRSPHIGYRLKFREWLIAVWLAAD